MSGWLFAFHDDTPRERIEPYLRAGYRLVLGFDRSLFDSSWPKPVILHDLVKEDGSLLSETLHALDEMGSDWAGEKKIWQAVSAQLAVYFLRKIVRNRMCVERLLEVLGVPEALVLDGDSDPAAYWLLELARRRDIPINILKRSHPGWIRASMVAAVSPWRRALRGFLCPGAGQKPEVLFLSVVDRQLDAMLPVAARLLDGEAASVAFALSRSSSRTRELEALGASVVHFERYAEFRDAGRARTAVERGRPFRLGEKARSPVWKVFGKGLEPLLRLRFESAARDVFLAERLIADLAPARLVTTDLCHPLVRAACLSADERRIPSINLQYGQCDPYPLDWSLALQDRLFMSGEHSMRVLSGGGVVASERLVLTGAPRFDARIFSAVSNGRAGARRRLGMAGDGKVVLYLSIPADSNELGRIEGTMRLLERRRTLQAVLEAVGTLQDAVLTIRPHPEEDCMEIRSLCGELGFPDVRIDVESSLPSLLAAADVAITVHTTAGLEAVLADCPLINLNLTQKPDLLPYGAGGVALDARSPKELRTVLSRLLYDADAAAALRLGKERFLKEHFHLWPEPSAERVGAKILREEPRWA